MVFDPFLQRVVLFGGSDGIANYFGDTWLWDGSNWTQASTASGPAARELPAMVMDARWPYALLFGGVFAGATGPPVFVNDTWMLWTNQPPSATFGTFGSGCAGTAGTPRLQAAPGSRPIIGTEFTMELEQLPTIIFAVPFGVIGFDRTAWAGSSLPVDLGFVGMPGCQAWINPEFSVGLANVQGRATWHLMIPPLPQIVGLHFYVQGFVFDFGANAGNAVVSNAGDGQIGV